MVDKKSSFEVKQQYLKENIENINTTDTKAIYNIILMLGNTNLDENLFKEEDVLFQDLMEFSDLKTSLKPSLTKLKEDLAYLYLLVIKSSRPIVSVKNENILKLSPLHRILLMNLGVFTLGNILANNIKSISEDKLHNDLVVEDAIFVLQKIMSPIAVLGDILEGQKQ